MGGYHNTIPFIQADELEKMSLYSTIKCNIKHQKFAKQSQQQWRCHKKVELFILRLFVILLIRFILPSGNYAILSSIYISVHVCLFSSYFSWCFWRFSISFTFFLPLNRYNFYCNASNILEYTTSKEHSVDHCNYCWIFLSIPIIFLSIRNSRVQRFFAHLLW